MARKLEPAVAVALAFGVLSAAWAVTTPPFSSPDEWAHYLRALSIAHGQILGRPIVDYPKGLTEAQRSWVLQATRTVDVPPHLDPTGYACHVFAPEKSAACNDRVVSPAAAGERIIPNGTYQPAAYFAPASLVRLGASATSALLFGRLAIVLACASLLLLALRALGSQGVSGLLLAWTPMTAFLAGMLNPSGLEIFAAIAFLGGLIAVARGGESTKHGWVAATAGGLILPLSRSLGGVYLPIIAGLWTFAIGPRRVLELVRSSRAHAAGCAAASLAGLVANRAWEHLYGPKVPADTSSLGAAIAAAFTQFPGWLMQQAGNFQYIDTPLPEAIYAAWLACIIALLGLALVKGTWADRRGILASLAVAVSIPIALQVLVLRPVEWLVQGRHVIAVTLPALLFAGESVERRPSAAVRPLLATCLAVWAAGQLCGFWVSAHRSAVGLEGPVWFLGASEWQPPLGWTIWLVALMGALGSIAVSLWSSSSGRHVEGGPQGAENARTQHV